LSTSSSPRGTHTTPVLQAGTPGIPVNGQPTTVKETIAYLADKIIDLPPYQPTAGRDLWHGSRRPPIPSTPYSPAFPVQGLRSALHSGTLEFNVTLNHYTTLRPLHRSCATDQREATHHPHRDKPTIDQGADRFAKNAQINSFRAFGETG